MLSLFFVCLFLNLEGKAQEKIPENLESAYASLLSWDIGQARKLANQVAIAEGHHAWNIYILSSADILEALLTENPELLSEFDAITEKRLKALKKTKSAEKWQLAVKAELHLHNCLIQLRMGNQWQAAWQLRKSWIAAREGIEKYPGFEPVKRTNGILYVMLGVIPPNYKWALRLFNMETSLQEGLSMLKEVAFKSTTYHALEAKLILSILHFLLSDTPEEAVKILNSTFAVYPDYASVSFLLAMARQKAGLGNEALSTLQKFDKIQKNEIAKPLANRLKGLLYLQRGDYSKAVMAYRAFLDHYEGESFRKDATFRIALAYYLDGNTIAFDKAWKAARNSEATVTEQDIYAGKLLEEDDPGARSLWKIRLLTDGGYYDEAKKISPSEDIDTHHEETEWIYRQANLAHKMKEYDLALSLYSQTIEVQKEQDLYFAPNALLQSGYILWEQGKKEEARKKWASISNYSNYSYETSIRQKAEMALKR